MLVPVHPAPLLGHSHTSLQLAPWEICRATESSGKHAPGISDPRRPRGMRRKRVEGWDGRPWCADPRSSWHHGGLTCWDSSVGLWTGASLILRMARGQPMPLLLFLTQDTLLLGWPHPPLPGLAEKRLTDLFSCTTSVSRRPITCQEFRIQRIYSREQNRQKSRP